MKKKIKKKNENENSNRIRTCSLEFDNIEQGPVVQTTLALMLALVLTLKS